MQYNIIYILGLNIHCVLLERFLYLGLKEATEGKLLSLFSFRTILSSLFLIKFVLFMLFFCFLDLAK